jgi:hypothetical protein
VLKCPTGNFQDLNEKGFLNLVREKPFSLFMLSGGTQFLSELVATPRILVLLSRIFFYLVCEAIGTVATLGLLYQHDSEDDCGEADGM